jgi:membrane-bound ClpP family serine protease
MSPNKCESTPKSIPWIIISRLSGLVVFLILLLLLNAMKSVMQNRIFGEITNFLSQPGTIWLLVIITVLLLFGDLFSALHVPLSLPAPLFYALGGVFLVSFFFRLLYLVDQLTITTNFSILRPIAPLVYAVIFLLILIFGYVEFFSKLICYEREETRQHPQDINGSDKPPAEGEVTWERIGSEFRQLLYDILHALRMALKGGE